MAVLPATVPRRFPKWWRTKCFEWDFTCQQYIYFVSDGYLGRKNMKNRFIPNFKPLWLNYITSSLRQRRDLHIYDFETTNS